ncbi:hypothetical protein FEM48_ZijujUnG0074100 [Ziziphus jujuba var. spinosa]|uniref:Uncharacterized protein n=1 Tax=Ziziphus jujuba var. spinosa TaxID=714518 RepID=A0A978U8U0_ZIZJJ|nr:hypothetical protein FEM48_ZijujUnG0074100 [Ziziphus jujuba var. spinosa]
MSKTGNEDSIWKLPQLKRLILKLINVAQKAKWNCQYEIDHEGLNEDDQEQAGIFPIIMEVKQRRVLKVFDGLEELELYNLQNLRSFYSGSCVMRFPKLEGSYGDDLDEDGKLLLDHYEFSSFPVQQLEEGDINAAIRKLWLNNQGESHRLESKLLAENPRYEYDKLLVNSLVGYSSTANLESFKTLDLISVEPRLVGGLVKDKR